MHNIKLSSFGVLLATRSGAAEVSAQVIEGMESAGMVALDMGGVVMLSLSFADELAGRLIKHFGIETVKNNLVIINASSTVRTVYSKAVSMNSVEPKIYHQTGLESPNLNCI